MLDSESAAGVDHGVHDAAAAAGAEADVDGWVSEQTKALQSLIVTCRLCNATNADEDTSM